MLVALAVAWLLFTLEGGGLDDDDGVGGGEAEVGDRGEVGLLEGRRGLRGEAAFWLL